MHWWWQNRYLGPKGELWGGWFCSGCGVTTTGFMPLNCSCGRDWHYGMQYKEPLVENKELGYVGHTDGILVDRMSLVKRIFEFKSISPSEFDKLKKPKGGHVIQAHAYMKPLGLNEAMIVYQNKGSQCYWSVNDLGELTAGDIKLKAYLVKFDNDLWKLVEEQVKERHSAVAELDQMLKDGKPITEEFACSFKRICKNKSADAADYCPMKSKCFKSWAPGDAPKGPNDDYRMPI